MAYPRLGLLLLALLLARPAEAAEPNDPYEGFNRITFEINRQFYGALAGAGAGLSLVSLPAEVKAGVHSVFRTLREPIGAAAALLTLDAATAGTEITRFAINATAGVFGTRDVASGMGYKPVQADLGTELCRAKVLVDQPYLVLPLLGPTNIGDILGQVGTNVALRALVGSYYYLPYYVLDRIDLYTQRQAAATPAAQAPPADPYVAQRAAYLARRARRCAPPGTGP